MKIEIVKDDATGALVVWQDDTNSGILCLGEMIEQILGLLKLPNRQPYPMKTPDEWAAGWKKLATKKEPTP